VPFAEVNAAEPAGRLEPMGILAVTGVVFVRLVIKVNVSVPLVTVVGT
jgi:hypothetical protein